MKKHPAKFSDPIMDVLRELVKDRACVLDPFAGVGRVHDLGVFSVGIEIEPEWADMHERTEVGDALHLPYGAGSFDTVVTSPTYGNRMADHHNAREKCRGCMGQGCDKCDQQGFRVWKRNTYRHVLGRELSPHNSGALQWGPKYREFHERAWSEVRRVLTVAPRRGMFILNISNHIRKGQEQYVSEWHRDHLVDHGFTLLDDIHVPTKRNRQGANGDLRVAHEHVYVFEKNG